MLLVFALFFFQSPEALNNTATNFFDADSDELWYSETVVVASKMPEFVEKAPGSISVFNRADIQALGVKTLDELLNFVPGFQTSRTDEDIVKTNRITVRGRRSASDSFDVLILLDGHRLNDQLIGGAVRNNNEINLSNIRQVEIIRGPGSALYGANAFLGVINLITDHSKNEVQLNLGSFGLAEGSLNFSRILGLGQFSLFARGSTSRGEFYGKDSGLLDLDHKPAQTRDPETQFDLYLSYQSERLRLNLRYFDRQQRDFSHLGLITNGLRDANSKVYSVNLSYNFLQSPTDQLKFVLGALFTGLNANVPLYSAADPFVQENTDHPAMLIGGDRQLQHQYSSALEYSHTFSKQTFSAGLYIEKAAMDRWYFSTNFDTPALFRQEFPLQVFEDQSIEHGGPRGDIAAAHRDVMGIYLQDKLQLHKQLELTIGIRQDRYTNFASSYNPRIGLVYHSPSIFSDFKWLYGKAFRAPSFKELSELSLSYHGNPSLKPETIQTYEFAWLYTRSVYQSSLSYYHSFIENGVAQVVYPELGYHYTTPENRIQLKLEGLEWENQMHFNRKTLLRTSLTWMLRQENPHTTPQRTLSFFWSYLARPVTLKYNSYYHGELGSPDATVYFPSYWVHDAAVVWELKSNLSLELKGENLFDNSYKSYNVNTPTGLPNAGRNFEIGLKCSGL